MNALTGLTPYGTYPSATIGTAPLAAVTASLDGLLAVIPDPDTAPAQGGGGTLDEMNPGTAAQLRVEVAALLAVLSAS